jgi:hypothetical protein
MKVENPSWVPLIYKKYIKPLLCSLKEVSLPTPTVKIDYSKIKAILA